MHTNENPDRLFKTGRKRVDICIGKASRGAKAKATRMLQCKKCSNLFEDSNIEGFNVCPKCGAREVTRDNFKPVAFGVV